jgi:DNA-binding FadR family transcriptional regulator
MLVQFINEILSMVRRFKATPYTYPGRALEIFGEHDAILAALRVRDPETAERVAREHMRAGLNVRIQQEIPARIGSESVDR